MDIKETKSGKPYISIGVAEYLDSKKEIQKRISEIGLLICIKTKQ